MTPIEVNDQPIEPDWSSFGIKRMNFRPHFDGDLVNVFSTVQPQFTEQMTEELMKKCAKELSLWVLENRDQFGEGDRFQIIIGWPKSIREYSRQVIKTGGTYEELEQIVKGKKPIEMKRSWSLGIFETSFDK